MSTYCLLVYIWSLCIILFSTTFVSTFRSPLHFIMMIKKVIVLAAFLTAKGQEVPSNPNNLLLRGSTGGEVFTETNKQDDYGFDFENERLEQLTCKALGEKCRDPFPNCCDGQCTGKYMKKTCQCVGHDPTVSSGTRFVGSLCAFDSQCCSGHCIWKSVGDSYGYCTKLAS